MSIVSIRSFAAIVLLGFFNLTQAAPIDPVGQWYRASETPTYSAPDFDVRHLDVHALPSITRPSLIGGQYFFRGDFKVDTNGLFVIDFKNSSTIARFKHWVIDDEGHVLAVLPGGIEDTSPNVFFMRHGRIVNLVAGHYQLVTEMASPYFIVAPQPFIEGIEDYVVEIKYPSALTLMCLGIFIGLGLYYAALAGVRLHVAEAMYTIFIFGNLVFNSATLMVLRDLFNIHDFYLTSMPILFSNMAYIVFVMHLLCIKPTTHRRLFFTGIGILVVMLSFVALAAWHLNWSLELSRYGVGLFLSYGLAASVITVIRGNRSARFYLLAILVFFALGGLTITSQGKVDEYNFYIEHLGLFSVTAEVLLLALVLSYQFAELHRDKEKALVQLEASEKLAMTDALTGLPNRYSLEFELARLPTHGSLTFLDLDGLKYYNDQFGHQRGDQLLQMFGEILGQKLQGLAIAHRLGGDEFAITCASDDVAFIAQVLDETVEHLKRHGFEFTGFSSGTVHVRESTDIRNLMHLADTRMYANKRFRKSTILEMTEVQIGGSHPGMII